MPYANDRVYLGADSHLMAQPNFLRNFASADIRTQLSPLDARNLIAHSNDRLSLFFSDYPHFEGSKNPIERFEQFLGQAGISASSRDSFYEDYFRRLFISAA